MDQIDQRYEQHATATLILCLQGMAKIDLLDQEHVLQSGTAAFIDAGTWHRHWPINPDSITISQGFICGSSDLFIDVGQQRFIATIPYDPSHLLVTAAIKSQDTIERLQKTKDVLANILREQTKPLTVPHPAQYQMELALWKNLHKRNVTHHIVEASGLSRAQAYRLFQSQRGMPIKQSVLNERIRLALHLNQHNLPIDSIMQQCGFHDRQALDRASLRFTGRRWSQHQPA